jgi:hypothetical protein
MIFDRSTGGRHMAETEMVERVARALYAVTPFKQTEGGYDEQSDVYRRSCILLARAAIEAMRVVPQDADAAGLLAAMEQVAPFIEKVTERHGFNAGSAARVACGDGRLYHAWYNAMIDAALSPSKE